MYYIFEMRRITKKYERLFITNPELIYDDKDFHIENLHVYIYIQRERERESIDNVFISDFFFSISFIQMEFHAYEKELSCMYFKGTMSTLLK